MYKEKLRQAIAANLIDHGFNEVDNDALEGLQKLLQYYISGCCKLSNDFAQHGMVFYIRLSSSFSWS